MSGFRSNQSYFLYFWAIVSDVELNLIAAIIHYVLEDHLPRENLPIFDGTVIAWVCYGLLRERWANGDFDSVFIW